MSSFLDIQREDGVVVLTLNRPEKRNAISTREECDEVVEACHALVLPSWRKGKPTSIMEGMSMGRAAVVTDVPGCREVVEDGVNGCICAAHDPRALAAAMRRLLDEPGLLVRMGAAGRDLACREFDAEVVAEKILVDMRVPRAAG